MKKFMFLLAALAILALPSQVDAYGAAHYGATRVGPAGAYHTGRTVVSGPGGVRVAGHTTAVGAGGGVYRGGYAGGAGYGGAGGYRYGYGAPGYGYGGYGYRGAAYGFGGVGSTFGSNYNRNAAAAAANGAYR